MASTELQKRPQYQVSPQDEPSAEWGWHGTFPKGGKIAGWATVLIMFGMMIGNQKGHVETIYLGLFGLAFIVGLVIKQIHARTSWRR